MARPVEWTPERKTEAQAYICQQIALGRSLVKICEEPDTPSYWTVMQWRANDDAFAQSYARAREDQADFYAEEIIDIADEEKDSNLARVRIDARKWKAGKLKPKVYGDRVNLDGDFNVRMDDGQVESRLAYLLGKAGTIASAGREGTAEGEAEALHPLPGFRASET